MCIPESMKEVRSDGPERFLSPKLDVVFKTLFVRNQDLLASFVAAIMERNPESIRDLRVLTPKYLTVLPDNEYDRLDLTLYMDYRTVNMEIRVKKYPDYLERSIFDWSKMITSDVDGEEPYVTPRKTVIVNILDYNIFDDPENYDTEVLPAVRMTGQVFSDKLSIRFIELKKFQDYAGTGLLALWLRLLNAENKADLDMIKAAGNETVNRAIEKICEMSADEKICEQARMREKALLDEALLMNGVREEGKAEGRSEGKVEGRTEGRIEGFVVSVKGIINRFGVNREGALQIAQVPPEYRQAVIAGL